LLTSRPVVPTTLRRAFVRVSPVMLPLWFLIGSLSKVQFFWGNGLLGVDYFIYREAGLAALGGADPWATSYLGFRFAAPPPTVMPYAILALLPEGLGLAVSVAVLGTAAVVVVRALGLPWWWLLFPPLVESLLGQNPDVLVIALLVAGGRHWGALAPVFKIYGGIPLLFHRRWREAVLAGVMCLVSLPLVPAYLARFGEVTAILAQQATGASPAWRLLFVAPALIAMWYLGRERAGWLAVPALWPSSQPHYNCLAMPVLREHRLAAAVATVPLPGVAGIAAVVLALVAYRSRRSSASAAPEDQPFVRPPDEIPAR
jgi:hypothetical protein